MEEKESQTKIYTARFSAEQGKIERKKGSGLHSVQEGEKKQTLRKRGENIVENHTKQDTKHFERLLRTIRKHFNQS